MGSMIGTTVTSLVILIFVFITIGAGVRIVPQGEEWIVQRLGKYRVTLLPGSTSRATSSFSTWVCVGRRVASVGFPESR